jgi:hypothetical protein
MPEENIEQLIDSLSSLLAYGQNNDYVKNKKAIKKRLMELPESDKEQLSKEVRENLRKIGIIPLMKKRSELESVV